MLWLEVMYKLAVGQVGPNDRIDSTPLRDFFNNSTVPQGSDTLRNLLLGKTKSYKYVIIERRALGSCFHTIQDSYAVGHCQRRLANPWDKDNVLPSIWSKAWSLTKVVAQAPVAV